MSQHKVKIKESESVSSHPLTATSGELATMNIVSHQSFVFYKNQIYDLYLERGLVESKQGRIIFKECTEPSCNLDSFLIITLYHIVNIMAGNNFSVKKF